MKTQPFVSILSLGLTCFAAPATAQNLRLQSALELTRPTHQRAEAALSDSEPLCIVRNSPGLDSRLSTSIDRSAIIHAEVLSEPSIYKTGSGDDSSNTEEILRNHLILLTATYREAMKPADGNEVHELILSVRQRIRSEPDQVLEIVAGEISANPSLACEIVRESIRTTDANTSLVIQIVESAILAAPDSMRLISQCAIASAPEALPAIQGLLAKLDPHGGDADLSAKSVIGARVSSPPVIAQPNPLDRPQGLPIPPLPIIPPVVSGVDP